MRASPASEFVAGNANLATAVEIVEVVLREADIVIDELAFGHQIHSVAQSVAFLRHVAQRLNFDELTRLLSAPNFAIELKGERNATRMRMRLCYQQAKSEMRQRLGSDGVFGLCPVPDDGVRAGAAL
jgi:hypothetical protein